MKRPFSLLGAVVLIASFLNLYIGYVAAGLFSLAVAILLLIKYRKNQKGVLCFALLIVFVFNIIGSAYKQNEATKLIGERVIDAGIIKVDEELSYNRITVSTKVGSLRFKAQLFDYTGEDYTEGDKITLLVKLKQPGKDMETYLNSNGVYLSGQVTKITDKTEGKGIYKGFYYIRNYVERTLIKAVGYNSAAPLIALVTGNQDFLDDETIREVKAAGVSHIMVVSGLHLGIICGAVLNLLRRLKAKPKFKFLVGLASVMAVLGLCGFHISASRSAITYIVMLFGILIKRKADPLNSLGFSVFLITLVNPFVAGSTSFLLSVSATFGVIYLAPKLFSICQIKNLNGKAAMLLNGVCEALLVSVAALICVSPILIFTFGSLSVGSIFVNILIAHAVSFALVLTVLGIAVSFIPFVCDLILRVAAAVGGYVMWIINIFGSSERFLFYFGTVGKTVFLVLAVVIIFSIIYISKRKKRKEEEYAG